MPAVSAISFVIDDVNFTNHIIGVGVYNFNSWSKMLVWLHWNSVVHISTVENEGAASLYTEFNLAFVSVSDIFQIKKFITA